MPHGHGLELQVVRSLERSDSGDKAEMWLKRGASVGDLRKEERKGVLGTKTVKMWGKDGEGDRRED
jgi:hypothetical protein